MLGTGVLFIDSHFVLNKFNLVAGGLGEEAESAGGVGESFGAADGSVGLKDVGACSSKGFRVGRKKEEMLVPVAAAAGSERRREEEEDTGAAAAAGEHAFLEGAILLEEFCKELSSLVLVKDQLLSVKNS